MKNKRFENRLYSENLGIMNNGKLINELDPVSRVHSCPTEKCLGSLGCSGGCGGLGTSSSSASVVQACMGFLCALGFLL